VFNRDLCFPKFKKKREITEGDIFRNILHFKKYGCGFNTVNVKYNFCHVDVDINIHDV